MIQNSRLKFDIIELANEMLDQLDPSLFERKDTTFLDPAIAGGQMLRAVEDRLRACGHTDENISKRVFGVYENLLHIGFARKKNNLACQIIDHNIITEKGMKFDVTIGNPPFSLVNKKGGRGRGKDLYPDFYRNAITNSDVVAMIMPNTQQTVNKKHNDFLRETANRIVPCKFDGINLATWYVISDGSDSKPDVEWIHNGQDQNNVNFAKGKLNVSSDVDCLKRDKKRKGDITVYHKVTGTTGLVIKYCSPKMVPKRKRFPESGYALLMPQAINDKGWSKTAIVKCTGNEAAMNGVNIAFFDTKKEAMKLRDYMKTEEYIENACKVRGGLGNMTLSAMKRVPINI